MWLSKSRTTWAVSELRYQSRLAVLSEPIAVATASEFYHLSAVYRLNCTMSLQSFPAADMTQLTPAAVTEVARYT